MSNDTTPSDAEKIRSLIKHDTSHYDSNTLHEILTDGFPEAGIEPLDGNARVVVNDWLANDRGDDWTGKVWSNFDSIIERLERLAVYDATERIQHRTETGGLGTRLHALKDELDGLSPWLRPQVVARERASAESAMFGHPEDWQHLIGVLQVEHEFDAYTEGRDETDNHDERREAWDELLKFTKYRVEVTYTINRGTTSLTREGWSQSRATIQNRYVNRIPDDGDFEDCSIVALERFQPGDVQDPLPDLEEFVYY